MFTHLLVRLDSAILGLFGFTSYITNTLDFFLHWLLGHVQSRESRGVRSWGFLQILLFEQDAHVSPPDFLENIRSCRRYFLFLLFWRSSMGIFSSLVPCLLRGFSKVINGMPCNCKWCLRSYCNSLLLSTSHYEEGIIGFSSLFSDGLC